MAVETAKSQRNDVCFVVAAIPFEGRQEGAK